MPRPHGADDALLRSRVALHVPRRRAHRAPRRRRRLAARHAAAARLPRGDERGRRRRSGARMRCGCRSCGPSASPRACRRRCASRPTRNEQGCGSAFAIAAGRLAFCGGFDLEDPTSSPRRRPRPASTSTARWPPRATRAATIRSTWRAGWSAMPAGTVLPALEHERRIYCGEPRITAWLSQAAAPSRGRARPTRRVPELFLIGAGIAPPRCHNSVRDGPSTAIPVSPARPAIPADGRRPPVPARAPRRARRPRAPAALPADEQPELRRAARRGGAAGGARQRELDPARTAAADAGRRMAERRARPRRDDRRVARARVHAEHVRAARAHGPDPAA